MRDLSVKTSKSTHDAVITKGWFEPKERVFQTSTLQKSSFWFLQKGRKMRNSKTRRLHIFIEDVFCILFFLAKMITEILQVLLLTSFSLRSRLFVVPFRSTFSSFPSKVFHLVSWWCKCAWRCGYSNSLHSWRCFFHKKDKPCCLWVTWISFASCLGFPWWLKEKSRQTLYRGLVRFGKYRKSLYVLDW